MPSIRCWIFGGDQNERFIARISSFEPIVELQDTVKHVCAIRQPLKKVDETNIIFYKASIFAHDSAFQDKVTEIINNEAPIHPQTLISDLFEPVLDMQYIHLIACLESPPRGPIQLPKAPVGSEVAARRLRFLNACTSNAHFSQGKPRTFLRDERNQSETILCNPPCIVSRPIPPTLLHPVFGQFVDDCETYKPTTEDHQLVVELATVMSDFGPGEQERQLEAEIFHVFAKHGIEFNSTRIVGTDIMTDGDISHRSVRYAIAVFKRDIGSSGGDLYLQGGLYHLESSRNVAGELSNSVLPCIMIHIFGPYIGFAGSAWTDRTTMQTLSTIIPMHHHRTDTATRYEAARHMGALRSAIHSLGTYYRDEAQAREIPLASLPPPQNPMFPYPSSFTSLDDSSKKSFTYTSHPMDSKLIFIGKLLDGDRDICIKFVHEYSPDAHAFCASKGFAPSLHGFEKLPGGWFMVVMDRIPSDFVKLRDFFGFTLDTWEAFFDDIRDHLREMHRANFVHGDISNTNIMVKLTDGVFSFLLVDFNSSGVRGVARYPMNDSLNIWRPEEACDGELITAEHDIETLDEIWCFS